MQHAEQPLCPGCGYPVQSGQHAPNCPIQNKKESSKEQTPETNIEMLFDHNFRIQEIKNGDKIPVGGANFLKNVFDFHVIADLDSFSDFLEQTHAEVGKVNIEALRSILEREPIHVDPILFAKLIAFTRSYAHSAYASDKPDTQKREELYANKQNAPTLSEVFKARAAKCTEIATLAQAFLQQEHVDSSLFSGEVLKDPDELFPSDHTFLVIRSGEQIFVYDPTNPMQTDIGPMPALFASDLDFNNVMDQKKKGFVSMKNFFTKKESYYGSGDHASFNKKRHLVTN